MSLAGQCLGREKSLRRRAATLGPLLLLVLLDLFEGRDWLPPASPPGLPLTVSSRAPVPAFCGAGSGAAWTWNGPGWRVGGGAGSVQSVWGGAVGVAPAGVFTASGTSSSGAAWNAAS